MSKAKHLTHEHAQGILKKVHEHLSQQGINGLQLKEMRFASAEDACPDGMHPEMRCHTQPDGTQVCTTECVPD